MPANVQTMAFYGNPPWHGLGTPVPFGVKAGEMIRAAGLDWNVELRPARGARKINRKGEYSRYEVMRVPRPTTDEGEVLLGVVSRRYQPLQNIEAFEFFDLIVGQKEAYFETAGALGEGERIWVMARMPDVMEIVSSDECLKYLLLSNSHTGDGSVIVKFTSVRVVCQNTLIMAMEDGQKAYRVRHSKKMQFRLDEISEFLSLTQEVFLKAQESFRRLAAIQMIGDRLDRYFGAVFPPSEAQRKKRERPDRWRVLTELFESRPDLQIRGLQGTLWAAYNAITYLEDYREPNHEELDDQRLERAWFGKGADVKLKAFEKATELAANWN
jgi:phage/plasmid-like protein (TIGR03299 family)